MATFNNGESGLSVRTKINNVLQHADGTAGELVINEAGADVDFRVESDTNANALFVDGTTGDVGIGITPAVRLHSYQFFGGTTARLQTGTTANGNFLDFYNAASARQGLVGFIDSTNLYIHNDDAAAIIFDTNSTERLRIDSSGNVGIGTSSPATLLHLGGASNKAVRLDTALGNAAFLAGWENTLQIGVNRNPANGVLTDGGKAAAAVRLVGEAGNSYLTVETTSTNNAAPTERLRIDANGNVGIGTSSPEVKLDVVGDAYISGTLFPDSIASYSGDLPINIAGNSFIVNAGATERMRVDASGNLLIGTATSGASKLRISGLPTSSAGLSAGDVWNDGGTLKIA